MSEEITNGIRNLIAKLDNGSHSSSQLQAIDEALTDLFSQALQKRDEAIIKLLESKYQVGLQEGQTLGEWRQRDDLRLELLSTLTTK